MSRRIKDKPAPDSRRNSLKPDRSAAPASNSPNEAAHFSFSDAAPRLSDSELRETAYEILVGACRSTGGKTLTFIPQSEKNGEKTAPAVSAGSSASLQRSLTSTAASKVKKALGLKKRRSGGESADLDRGKKAVTAGELMRVQMGVSEQTDSRIRRALLRIAAGQLGRKIETMVLPLELLQQLKSTDFPEQQEYQVWQKRNLKLLEAGLLLHPYVALDKKDAAPQRLRQIIRGALDRPLETGKNNESMQGLRNVVMSLACRSFDGSVSETCHWADGFPFNLRLYKTLLEACFDVNDEASVIEEVDEVLELIKKTWAVLGMNQTLHNLCFLWVLFNRFIATGQIESDLLFAANNLMLEVEKDAKATKDTNYSKVLSSVLSSIMGWAEKKLVAYHDTFNSDNTESMESVVSLGVLAAKLMVEDISHEYHKRKVIDVASDRVDTYIRKSLRSAFAQIMEQAKYRKLSSKNQQNQLPLLSILAQDVGALAFSEKAIFSPMLKRWHPHAAGVAVATLHSCYGNELKKFVSGISELTPDGIQVLRAADKLEKDLVQIAVEDSVDSEDGGMSIIREMPPYEAEAVIANLVKSWIKTRLDRLKEWVDRNLQQEVWNPRVNREQVAPSAVEVLRLVDETLEAFFLLPIPIHAVLLPEFNTGLDRCLKYYISRAKSGCGNPNTFIPPMPPLTRCTTGSRFFKKKEKSLVVPRKRTQVGTTNSNKVIGIPQLCCRINTLQLIRTELEVLEKRTATHLKNSESANAGDITNGVGKMFELSAASCVEGIQQLSEATAYKVVFQDLNHVLWDNLYVSDVSSSRIKPFLQELERHLEIISSTVHDRVRTRVVTYIMKASFNGFLLVLLAGGPSRAFALVDYELIAEDFKFMTDLFWSNGDGLPDDIIEKFSSTVKGILPLFQSDTESIIEQFKRITVESYGPSAKSRLPLPPTTGQWSPTEPNTLLRVLCYRCDETAAKFLKKNYNLPTKLQ